MAKDDVSQLAQGSSSAFNKRKQQKQVGKIGKEQAEQPTFHNFGFNQPFYSVASSMLLPSKV
ncbi:hypothetical protein EGR_05420 [Echinococcus granulosus]|uniref:Uncharacterized protein n=1 Tax=Echinococcus granulosus TaxID=6210 RepID=W6UEY8_ECHGR|nr:hypothetical protein EGR_05420 [Echinococcus granulosus]EUB59658.1 hypothetical protein EGR_05420 [Echinococcus granulosus]